jgi:D-lactate dehydrogenase
MTAATLYAELAAELARSLPESRLLRDPLRRLAYGTDASFYRLIPELVVVVESEEEVRVVLAACRRFRAPVTFRAAGTSLSGQSVTDSVLAVLGDAWRGVRVERDGASVRLQPGVIGADANRALAPLGRRIGPDPASLHAAKIGGIAANNASGMCCGTAQNSYHTLEAVRVVLADGAVLDTADPASREAFASTHAALLEGLGALRARTLGNETLAARIRHKFRMKNTTGYSLNALVDFDDPIDILAHLMIGSEGTLGFVSEITYRTVAEHPHKASALILFEHLGAACAAVARLRPEPVDAVELADRAALRSVAGKPGLPAAVAGLGPDTAALLVETRAATSEALAAQVARIGAALAGVETVEPVRFSADPGECAQWWNLRKGMFPSVGAMREIGTTVVIEDVAFPVPRLAEATLDLQALMRGHGYDGIIFGHALEGNLHFVFSLSLGSAAEIERYRGFMDALARLVVDKYDGSLKAEHGTGRNMAPFVELEWGRDACELMREIKRLLDPEGLLNPGVVLNDDPQIHVKNLKPLPVADPLVDKCIECGFCEPKCPSAGLTLTPRQRIVGLREIRRLEGTGEDPQGVEALRGLYAYQAIDTCAACGLCATACPVGIETGLLTKALRGRQAGPLAHRIADRVAGHFGATTAAVQAGLGAADLVHAAVGSAVLGKVTAGVRALSRGRVPRWTPAMPRPARFAPPAAPARPGRPGAAGRVVYFPSCASRTMGSARGDDTESLPAATARVLERAGFEIVYPAALAELCCGQPFETKGLAAAADRKSDELAAALAAAGGEDGATIVFDTSPCAYRMRRHLAGRLPIADIVEFLHDRVLPRLAVERVAGAVAIHPVCSVRKMGTEGKLRRIAEACAERVVEVPEVQCCGFAGDRGFTVPELNAYALRHLRGALPRDCREGFSTSRTCEIGLSEHGGRPYRSIVHLVERATRGRRGSTRFEQFPAVAARSDGESPPIEGK